MKTKLLEHLRDVTLKDVIVKKKPFNMGTWFTEYFTEFPDDTLNAPKPISCGFAACAGGHAALDPKFKRLGLKLDLQDKECGEVDGFVMYKGETGFAALAAFFEISHSDSGFIFDPTSYDTYTVTPAMVRNHITHVLNKEDSYED